LILTNKKFFFRDEHNTLTAEYTKATATYKAAHENHIMVKQFARKIREEKIKLLQENEKLQVFNLFPILYLMGIF